MLITLLASAFVFGMLVLVHELGHFVTAKLTGMQVDEFAIGFGPRLFSYKYGETVYSLRIVPLGGFNDIAGMNPEDNDAGDRGYSSKPILARMIVISAGSLMNFILPVFLFWGIFAYGGISSPSPEPVLGEVVAGKPAYIAGLRAGDRILRVNGTAVNDWSSFAKIIFNGEGKILTVDFQRDGAEKSVRVIPEYDKKARRPIVGVVSSAKTVKLGFFEAGKMAVQKTGFVIYKMVEGVWQLISGRAEGQIAGPIGVAQMAGEVANIGFLALLNFAALLSLNLGVINMLPVPALDGGYFVTLILEALRGKPLGAKATHYTQVVGISLLVALMVFATKNDIVRLITGG